MEIESVLGENLKVVYKDIELASQLEGRKVLGVHAYCFLGDKLVVVSSKGEWTLPGGSVEGSETPEEAVHREVAEEANMRVIKHALIGFQDIYEPFGVTTQTRSVCIVESNGGFVMDPDGDVSEVKLIDPKEYKNYFDWGEIGEHLINRALEVKATLRT